MNDLVYSIHAESGVVECTVQNCRNDFMRITDKMLSQYPQHIRYFYRFIASYRCEAMIQDEYTGKAVCSKLDVFDECYGKDVARTKAIIKRENAYESAFMQIFNDIEEMVDVNISIDRDSILDKHTDNLIQMLDSGRTLSDIKGYSKACDLETNNENDFMPHCCSLCNDTFLNYLDDENYASNENAWMVIKTTNNKVFEICPTCVSAINKFYH
jgi:hypothetical protein